MVTSMNLSKLKTALAGIKKPETVEEVSMRYVDPMGNTQTVPIGAVVEEVSHGESSGPRRVILVAGSASAPS